MRTTLTIDDDLAKRLKERAYQTGSPFKQVVNNALRTGLGQIDKPRRRSPYKCRSFSLGHPPKTDIDRALKLADEIESDEIARKLLLRK